MNNIPGPGRQDEELPPAQPQRPFQGGGPAPAGGRLNGVTGTVFGGSAPVERPLVDSSPSTRAMDINAQVKRDYIIENINQWARGELEPAGAPPLSEEQMTSREEAVGRIMRTMIGDTNNPLYLHRNLLNLGGLKLTSLPPAIGELTHVKYLNLVGNNLKELPDEFKKLENLERLFLACTNFSAFPDVICECKNLKVLCVIGKPEGGLRLRSLPTRFAELKNLETLDLTGNDFKIFPTIVCTLPNLKDLRCNNCNIKELPPRIGELTTLDKLEISGNQLTALPPDIGHLSNLRVLALSYNRLNSLPLSFGELQKLETLYLSNNQFAVFPSAIVNLGALSLLHFHENKIDKVPAAINKLKNLGELSLAKNNLTNIPEPILTMSGLWTLDLSGNKIESLPVALTGLSNLSRLDLKTNRLTSLPASIAHLTNLEDFDVSGNLLEELPEQIGELTNLNKLSFSGNVLETLPTKFFELTSLEILDLRHNNFQEIPGDIGRLKSLRVIHLDWNPLTCLPVEICDLKELDTLDLGECNLAYLPERIGDLVNLRKFVVSHNEELEVLPMSLGNCRKLAQLFCGYTAIPDSISMAIILRVSAARNSDGIISLSDRLDTWEAYAEVDIDGDITAPYKPAEQDAINRLLSQLELSQLMCRNGEQVKEFSSEILGVLQRPLEAALMCGFLTPELVQRSEGIQIQSVPDMAAMSAADVEHFDVNEVIREKLEEWVEKCAHTEDRLASLRVSIKMGFPDVVVERYKDLFNKDLDQLLDVLTPQELFSVFTAKDDNGQTWFHAYGTEVFSYAIPWIKKLQPDQIVQLMEMRDNRGKSLLHDPQVLEVISKNNLLKNITSSQRVIRLMDDLCLRDRAGRTPLHNPVAYAVAVEILERSFLAKRIRASFIPDNEGITPAHNPQVFSKVMSWVEVALSRPTDPTMQLPEPAELFRFLTRRDSEGNTFLADRARFQQAQTLVAVVDRWIQGLPAAEREEKRQLLQNAQKHQQQPPQIPRNEAL